MGVAWTAEHWRRILLDIADAVESKQEELSDLDRIIGDGDHGVSMSIGWRAVRNWLTEHPDEGDVGAMLQATAQTFLNAVGASVGPLYGMAFLRGGAQLKGLGSTDDRQLLQFWITATSAIRQMGKAEPGDKTMVDTWHPIAESLQRSLDEGEPWSEALDRAVAAGERGMLSTRELVSLKGRSGRLGERSRGHIDPGAASAQLLFSVFAGTAQAVQGGAAT